MRSRHGDKEGPSSNNNHGFADSNLHRGAADAPSINLGLSQGSSTASRATLLNGTGGEVAPAINLGLSHGNSSTSSATLFSVSGDAGGAGDAPTLAVVQTAIEHHQHEIASLKESLSTATSVEKLALKDTITKLDREKTLLVGIANSLKCKDQRILLLKAQLSNAEHTTVGSAVLVEQVAMLESDKTSLEGELMAEMDKNTELKRDKTSLEDNKNQLQRENFELRSWVAALLREKQAQKVTVEQLTAQLEAANLIS